MIGKASHWTAIGRRGNKAVAAGYFLEGGFTAFILCDLANKIIDSHHIIFEVNSQTLYIRLLDIGSRVFAVASRVYRYIDIIEIEGRRLYTNLGCMT